MRRTPVGRLFNIRMFIFNSSPLHPFVDFCQSLSVSKDSFF